MVFKKRIINKGYIDCPFDEEDLVSEESFHNNSNLFDNTSMPSLSAVQPPVEVFFSQSKVNKTWTRANLFRFWQKTRLSFTKRWSQVSSDSPIETGRWSRYSWFGGIKRAGFEYFKEIELFHILIQSTFHFWIFGIWIIVW